MRKTLAQLALLGTLALVGIGCNDERTVKETSDILYEDAIVSETVYSPSRHGSGVSPSVNTDFEIGFEFTSINIPEKYAVVFKCQHGKFIIENKQVWEKFSGGDSAIVEYKEVYETTYKETSEGRKKIVKRSLVDYDFLDAQPKHKH